VWVLQQAFERSAIEKLAPVDRDEMQILIGSSN
jgi:hypothetical protein